ncbi:7444_t:CDS:1, partial [Funneliformis geosporum]
PINTKGRKAKDVIVSKVKDIKKAEKEIEKIEKKKNIVNKLQEKHPLIYTQQNNNNLILLQQSSSSFLDLNVINIEDISEPSSKKQKIMRHLTTQEEKIY